jgi:type I restriction enzyme S subunit
MPMLEQVISNKAGWTRVAFGDVVRKVSDKVDPWKSGLERYVAGDHMDTDDLRIRRWGLIGDDYLGPAFHMRFKPGHVLYGSRRTYLRKVALADFEGITANTTYVLETKDPNVLMPELLPFIMQTEAFHAHSIARSKGSVNPYVNFSDIACFEFSLPPIQQQARLVETIHATSELNDRLFELQAATEQLLLSRLNETFRDDVATKPLAEWCRNLITYGIVQAGPDTPGGIPYIRVSDMTDSDTLSPDGMLRTSEEIAKKYRRSMVETGDIVIALRGPVGLTRFVPENLNGANLTQGTARVSVSPDNSSNYVFWALQSPLVKREYASHAKGSTFSEISLQALRMLPIPILAKAEQVRLASDFTSIDDKLVAVRARLKAARSLRQNLLGIGLGL